MLTTFISGFKDIITPFSKSNKLDKTTDANGITHWTFYPGIEPAENFQNKLSQFLHDIEHSFTLAEPSITFSYRGGEIVVYDEDSSAGFDFFSDEPDFGDRLFTHITQYCFVNQQYFDLIFNHFLALIPMSSSLERINKDRKRLVIKTLQFGQNQFSHPITSFMTVKLLEKYNKANLNDLSQILYLLEKLNNHNDINFFKNLFGCFTGLAIPEDQIFQIVQILKNNLGEQFSENNFKSIFPDFFQPNNHCMGLCIHKVDLLFLSQPSLIHKLDYQISFSTLRDIMPIIKLFNKDNFHSIIGCYIVTSEYPTTKIVVESEGGIDLEHFANYFVQLLEYYIKLDFHKFAYDKDSEEMNLSLMNFVKKLSTYDKLQSSLTNKTTLQKTVKV